MVPIYALAWHAEDDRGVYMIHLSGISGGESVYVKIHGYTPHFYVRVPKNYQDFQINNLVSEWNQKVGAQVKHDLLSYTVQEKKDFQSFQADTKHKFVRLVFCSYLAFQRYKKVIQRPIYEAHLDPFQRFLHIQKLNSVGWLQINGDIQAPVHWKNVKHYDCEDVPRILIASYDIECLGHDDEFPNPDHPDDKIIQIGTTFSYLGELDVHYQHIVTLQECASIEGADVECCDTEDDVIKTWQKMIRRLDPDLMIGYNIFGFDDGYLDKRSWGINGFNFGGRSKAKLTGYRLNGMFNQAMFHPSPGRVKIDMLSQARKFSLASYKLDDVASHFLQGEVLEMTKTNKLLKKAVFNHLNKYLVQNIKEFWPENYYWIDTPNTWPLKTGNYVQFSNDHGLTRKFQILSITPTKFLIEMLPSEAEEILTYDYQWKLVKNDMAYSLMHEYQARGPDTRAVMAKYCLQDCRLVSLLFHRLDIFTEVAELANVCNVPIQNQVTMGESSRVLNLVSRKSRKRGYLMFRPDQPMNDEPFQGANVLDPVKGIHFDPVVLLDYHALYPSSIIQKNLSPECIVSQPKYNNLDGWEYSDVVINMTTGNRRFVRVVQGQVGIIPDVLLDLLEKRKEVKSMMEEEDDPILKNRLDKRQKALKIVANSVYGCLGSPRSPLYSRDIAEAITSTGREMLQLAQDLTMEYYPDAEIVYGDTDSIFVKTPEGTSVSQAIEWGQELSDRINTVLPFPQKLEYEQTLWPMCLFSKKKYVGNAYYQDPNKFERVTKGYLTIRRDIPQVIKNIMDGTLDCILLNQDLHKARKYAKKSMLKLLRGKYPVQSFVVRKTLRNYYQNPGSIPHKVLADRMIERGENVGPGHRIPMIRVKDCRQYETPHYVSKFALLIDHQHYYQQLKRSMGQLFNLTPNFQISELHQEVEQEYMGRQDLSKWFKKR